jgi:hypothetical protein
VIAFRNMNEVPKNFDWVQARSKCSLNGVFDILGEVLDSDVKSANALGRPNARFTFSREAGKEFIVGRQIDVSSVQPSTYSVAFELTPDGISVKEVRPEKNLFSATPNFTLDGECLLAVNGEPMQLWQVSQMALEKVFFGS